MTAAAEAAVNVGKLQDPRRSYKTFPFDFGML